MVGSIEVISKRYILLAVGRENCLWYRNGKLWVSRDTDCADIREACDLYRGDSGRRSCGWMINTKAAQRILRLQPRACVMDGEGRVCFAFDRAVYIAGEDGAILDRSPVRKDCRNPLQAAWIHDIKGFRNAFVYGEYGWNTTGDCVNIMQYGEHRWETVYSFPPGAVKHIHGFVLDREDGCVYVLTGDSDSESGIWRATDNFSRVSPVMVGEQIFRSCAAILRNHAMIYATDTPIKDNYLMMANPDGQLTRLAALPGSVINSTENAKAWWFATAVEQNPDLPKILHRISVRKGPGIKDRNVHIFRFDNENELHEIAVLRKDWLPMWLFQFGNVSFVKNYRDDRVFAVPVATTRYSQMTVEIKA